MSAKERFGYDMPNGQKVLLGPGMAGNTFAGWVQIKGYGASGFYLDDESVRIPAALKVFSGGFGSVDTSGGALKREVMLLSRLDHPHIVKFLRFFYDGHQPVIATRLVEGKTLEERVREAFANNTDPGKEWHADVLEWGFHLAWVIDYLDKCGIVHRDIKPANVVIDATSEQPVLLDFGIGRHEPKVAKPGLTGAIPNTTVSRGAFVGTPHFASPEQFVSTDDKKPGHLTSGADVFALGVTLAYAICPDTVNLHEVVDRPEHRRYDTSLLPPPPSLRTLIDEMLSLDPAQRPEPGNVATRLAEILRKFFGRLVSKASVAPPPAFTADHQLPSFRPIGRGIEIATVLLNHYSASYFDPLAVDLIDAEDNKEVTRRDFDGARTLIRKINEHLVSEEWEYRLPTKDEWCAAAGFPVPGMQWVNRTSVFTDSGHELEWLTKPEWIAADRAGASECVQTGFMTSDSSPGFADRHKRWPKGAVRLVRVPRAEPEPTA